MYVKLKKKGNNYILILCRNERLNITIDRKIYFIKLYISIACEQKFLNSFPW